MKTFNYRTSSLATALLGFIFTVTLAGCTDSLLNQTPRGQQTVKNFFRNGSDALQATNATYNGQKGFSYIAFDFLALTDIASDDAVKGSTPSDNPRFQRINDFNFDPSNTAFENIFRPYYNDIFRANQGITNIPNIQDIDPDLQKRLIGENKFLRAYNYFFLARAFGGVPLVKKPLQPGEFDVKRSSLDSTYTFIENDLKAAAQALPAQYPASDVGRATKGAANAYLAKVYLFAKNYQLAEQTAQKVIDSGQYSLLPNYATIFTTKGENTSGTIFSIQALAVANFTGGTQYSQTQGVRGQPNLGFGFNNPSVNLVKAYEPGDPRLEPTVLFDYELLPDRSTVVRDNANITGQERYNQKAFVPIDIPGGTGNSGVNIRRFRYSDLLLVAAEAAAQNGNTAKAQQYVNQVRRRARNGQNATLGLQVEPTGAFLADTLGDASIENKPLIRLVQADGPAAGTDLNDFNFSLVNNSADLLISNLDVIQSINGVAVNSKQAFESQLKSVSPGQTVTLGVRQFNQSNNGGNISTSTQNLQVNVTATQLLPDITSTGQQLLNDIYHERRVELGMEQQRFFDIRHQGRAQQLLQALGINFTDKNKLYPIPQQEVDIGGLQQNPGY